MKALVFFVVVGLASSAYAQQAPTSSKGTADPMRTAASTEDEEVICERKKVVGSNVKERVCTTKAERAAAKDKAQRDLHRLGRCAANDVTCTGSL